MGKSLHGQKNKQCASLALVSTVEFRLLQDIQDVHNMPGRFDDSGVNHQLVAARRELREGGPHVDSGVE